MLDDIAGLYSAADGAGFDAKCQRLAERFATLERRLVAAPWFDGGAFRLVDAAAAPVFRYLDAFEHVGACAPTHGLPRIARWRATLAARPSVRNAVRADYPERLMAFLARRGSHLSSLILGRDAA